MSEVVRNRLPGNISSAKLNLFTNNQYSQSAFKTALITKPVLYSVNYAERKTQLYKISSHDYINLYPQKYYLREGYNLYFVGIKDDSAEDEVTYRVVNVSLD